MPARRLLEGGAGALMLAAAAIHAAVAPGHFAAWWGYGLFFVLAATAQAVYALVLFALPARPSWEGPAWRRWTFRLYASAIALNALLLLLWLATRTVGVPVGPEAGEVEPVGWLDGADKLAEAAAILLLALLAARAGARHAPLAPGSARVPQP